MKGSVLSDEGPTLKKLDCIVQLSISTVHVHQPFYILICISTLPAAAHYVYCTKYRLSKT